MKEEQDRETEKEGAWTHGQIKLTFMIMTKLMIPYWQILTCMLTLSYVTLI